MKLRYSEAFYSIQGEGKFVGVPSVFLRTFGCNFRCKKFGLPKSQEVGKYNPEVEKILNEGLDQYTKFEDLPIIHTGCDTYPSIYPEFKQFMKNEDVDTIVEKLLNLTPTKSWILDNGQDIHLILTGGEPMLWQKFWIALFSHKRMRDVKHVTIETNATQNLNSELEDFFKNKTNFNLTWSCSPKLTVSGEKWDHSIKPEIVKRYYTLPNSNLYFKFVVATAEDVAEVQKAVKEYSNYDIRPPVYLMPLGGRTEEYYLNKDEVVKLAMDQGWRYTPRLHVEVFKNNWST